MNNQESQWRATYEDTKQHQEKLRVKLDDLDSNNKCILIEEREKFFNLVADSLLGFDYEKECSITLPDGAGFDVPNAGEFLRYLAYYEKTDVGIDLLRRYGKIDKSPVKISDIWHELKFVVFGIYPEALAASIRISKEREQRDFSAEGGFTFGTKKKNKSNRPSRKTNL